MAQFELELEGRAKALWTSRREVVAFRDEKGVLSFGPAPPTSIGRWDLKSLAGNAGWCLLTHYPGQGSADRLTKSLPRPDQLGPTPTTSSARGISNRNSDAPVRL